MTLHPDGIYPDVPFLDYIRWRAWGASALKAMRQGPPSRVFDRVERMETDATILGTAAHAAILTPELYAAAYTVKPEGMTFATKEGKAWRDDPCRAGKILISGKVASRVEAIADALRRKAGVSETIGPNRAEASIVWTCRTTAERCKGRPDWYDDEYIYDLKVTRDAGPGMSHAAYRNGWMHQLAHYRTGARTLGLTRVRTGRIVAVHPEAPHYVWCVECREADLDVLALENENILARMRACRLANDWPGTPDEWTRIEMPQYAINEAVSVADAMEVEDGE